MIRFHRKNTISFRKFHNLFSVPAVNHVYNFQLQTMIFFVNIQINDRR